MADNQESSNTPSEQLKRIADTLSSTDYSSSVYTGFASTYPPPPSLSSSVCTVSTNTINTINTINTATGGRTWHSPQTLEISGPGADILINKVSLTNILSTIQERLNILVPDAELEKEWDELQALGDEYRKKTKEFKEKSRVWSALKKTES